MLRRNRDILRRSQATNVCLRCQARLLSGTNAVAEKKVQVKYFISKNSAPDQGPKIKHFYTGEEGADSKDLDTVELGKDETPVISPEVPVRRFRKVQASRTEEGTRVDLNPYKWQKSHEPYSVFKRRQQEWEQRKKATSKDGQQALGRYDDIPTTKYSNKILQQKKHRADTVKSGLLRYHGTGERVSSTEAAVKKFLGKHTATEQWYGHRRRRPEAFDERHWTPTYGEQRRELHTGRTLNVPEVELQSPNPADLPPIFDSLTYREARTLPVREQLALWQEKYGHRNMEPKDDFMDNNHDPGGLANNGVRLGTPDDYRKKGEEEEEEIDDFDAVRPIDETREQLTERTYLRPGDLCEIRDKMTSKDATLAVFIQEFPNQIQLYTIQGKWIHRKPQDAQFSISGFVDPKLIPPLVPYMPGAEVTDAELDQARVIGWDVPRNVSGPIITKLQQFNEQSKTIYRQYASTLDSAHKILAHPQDLRFGSLERIAKKLLFKDASSKKELTGPQLYAVRSALLSAGYAFGTDERSHRVTSVFQIRPHDQVELVKNVTAWIREYQDHVARAASISDDVDEGLDSLGMTKGARIVHDFLTKAKQLIAESRKTREATPVGCVGPSSQKHAITQTQEAVKMWTSTAFTNEEIQIIKFLENSAVNDKFRQHPQISGLAISLIRIAGTGPPNKTINYGYVYMFLQEIGVILPWENKVPYNEHLLLPIAQHSKPLMELANGVGSVMRDEPIDSMKALRRDFKNLTVFCVDGVGAQEIDDGISLERIPGTDEEFWVHTHIANPSAFLEPDSLVSKMAAHMTESIYMPEKNWTMLPSYLVHKHLSLKKDRPTLTFSVKLHKDGQILDHKIQNGIIRKVVSMTPSYLNKVLGFENTNQQDVTITVGGTIPETAMATGQTPRLSKQHVEDLKTLEQLARARLKLREIAGGSHINFDRADISVYVNHSHRGLPVATPSRRFARFFSGDPIIQMRAKEFRGPFTRDSGAALVQEMMLLTCEVAALWGRERHLPLLYRGTLDNPNLGSRERFIEEELRPRLDEHGNPPLHLALRALRLGGMSALSTKPLPHTYLGLPQYTKVTSPLRRYGDMMVHWQIESALREEARLGKSLARPSDAPWDNSNQSYLRFPNEQVEAVVSRMLPRERLISRSKENSLAFWHALLFFRAWQYNEAELPEYHRVLLMGQGMTKTLISARFGEYGTECMMVEPKNFGFGWDGRMGSGDGPQGASERKRSAFQTSGFGWRVGDWWKVKIQTVLPYLRMIVVTPVELISREVKEDEVTTGTGGEGGGI